MWTPPEKRNVLDKFVRNTLTSTRYFVLIAVAATGLAAIGLMIYGALAVVAQLWEFATNLDTIGYDRHAVENLALEFLALIDIFLLSTVLYIVSLGLYELFIAKLELPEWLVIENLDELKERMVSVVIVLLAVNFLGDYVEINAVSGDAIQILWSGLGSAAVIVALALTYSLMPKHTKPVARHAEALPGEREIASQQQSDHALVNEPESNRSRG